MDIKYIYTTVHFGEYDCGVAINVEFVPTGKWRLEETSTHTTMYIEITYPVDEWVGWWWNRQLITYYKTAWAHEREIKLIYQGNCYDEEN